MRHTTLFIYCRNLKSRTVWIKLFLSKMKRLLEYILAVLALITIICLLYSESPISLYIKITEHVIQPILNRGIERLLVLSFACFFIGSILVSIWTSCFSLMNHNYLIVVQTQNCGNCVLHYYFYHSIHLADCLSGCHHCKLWALSNGTTSSSWILLFWAVQLCLCYSLFNSSKSHKLVSKPWILYAI